jgi:hypothetical protein
MKTSIGILLVVFAVVCTASASAEALQKIVTTDGQVYEECRIVRVEPNGLLIEHTPEKGAVGLAKVRFAVLPPEMQKQFNYDASDAAQFESLQARSNLEWARQIEQQEKLNQELVQQYERDALALRLEEEKIQLENERMTAQNEHEINLIREEAYGIKEANRFLPPDFIVPYGVGHPNHRSHDRSKPAKR